MVYLLGTEHRILHECSITFHLDVSDETKYMSECTHVRTVCTHSQTHTQKKCFCTFFRSIFFYPLVSWADWRGGGWKRPSNRCGTKEQRALYLFASAVSVSPPLSPFPSVLLHSPHQPLSGHRCNYTKRARGRAAPRVFHCNAVSECGQHNLDEWLWRWGQKGRGGLHAIYCCWQGNIKPGTQTLTCGHSYAGTHTDSHKHAAWQPLATKYEESERPELVLVWCWSLKGRKLCKNNNTSVF